MPIRTLIVDDEPLARRRIRRLLKGDSEIEVVGESSNGREALTVIESARPDLLFLDVQMPELDGFGVLKALPAEKLPLVIFVTAYDQYALRAFEVYALDYLLKPFDRERFEHSLQRAKTVIKREQLGRLNQNLLALLEGFKSPPEYLERIAIKRGEGIFFLKVEEIDWVEAEGNYIRIHTAKGSHLLRETITGVENQLNPKRFLRIHRSTIVNFDRIQEIHPLFHGDCRIVLMNGTQLTLSRSYRDKYPQFSGRLL